MDARPQPALPEHLLEHAGWVRSLARALCRDEHAAADLEQETWLAALRGGAHARDAKAWLGSVARRLAASSGRSEGRRAAREADVAGSRPPDTPDAAETLASVELSARLARAVAELEEPYRTTLALRYYEGLPPRRIAQRLGVDERAIESRLRRGREKLREALDRRCGGREVWFGTALVLAFAGGEGAGRGASLAALLALLLGGGVAGGIAIQRARVDVPPEPRAALELREPDAPLEDGLAAPLAAAGPAREARLAVAAPRAGLELVVEGEQTPLASAYVVWHDARGRQEATSDADGRVHFGAGAGEGEIRVVVTGTERTRSHQTKVPASALTRLEIPHRGGRVVGTVVDLDHRPVPQAQIVAWTGPGRARNFHRPDRVAQADELGRFTMEDMASEHGWLQGWSLAARATGQCSFGTLDGQVDPRQAQSEVELVVEPAWQVRGRVSDAAGRALAAVPMTVFRSSFETGRGKKSVDGSGWNPSGYGPGFDLESGADGGFEFQIVGDAPDASVTWRLQANSPQHEMLLADIAGPGWLDVVLERGGRLEGVVLDDALRPVPQAKVRLTAHEDRDPALTDADGRFAFEGLSELEGALLGVAADGHALAVAVVDLQSGGAGQRIVLERPCRLSGVALDADGKPWANARVDFEGDRVIDSPWLPRSRGWTWEIQCLRSELVCDGQGRFTVEGLYPGRYVLQLRDPSPAAQDIAAYAEVELRTDSDAPALELRSGAGLERALTVRGRVLDASGAPAAQFMLNGRRYLEGEADSVRDVVQRSFAHVDGSFEIRGLRPGRWSFGAADRVDGVFVGTPSDEPQDIGPGVVDLGDLRFTAAPRR